MKLKDILAKSRYIILIPVFLSLIASVAAFLWGAIKTYHVIHELVLTGGEHGTAIGLISVMDTFLIATALFVFALGMYELFIEDVEFPEWLVIHDLHSLKAKLGSVIILVMAVSFLERLIHWEDAWETLLFAVAISLVSIVLIAFSHYGGKD